MQVDGVSDDFKMESQRDIHSRATDDLADVGLEGVHLSFHLTSIYDHSIFEAFSKVVQKLIPQLPTLENLLNIFISVHNSVIEIHSNHHNKTFFSVSEFWNWKGVFVWCSFKDLHCNRLFTCRYAKLRTVLWYDWRCYWFVMYLRVRFSDRLILGHQHYFNTFIAVQKMIPMSLPSTTKVLAS